MSGWRVVKTTGTNDTPLGNRRRFGAAPVEDAAPPQLAIPSLDEFPRSSPQESNLDGNKHEGRSILPRQVDEQPRKRRSRWGEAGLKTELPGLPTAISSQGLSQVQLDNYAIQLRLEEVNRKLRLNDCIPSERERSPSPPPTYDVHGRRTNTREARYRKKLEEERVRIVEKAMKLDPNFRPPAEYHHTKRSFRPLEKVYIPVQEFPEVNFFGLLVGPRGNTLKQMEKDSGAKISIRGKGSVKAGKERPDAVSDDAEEAMHCLVTADSQDKVEHCVRLINKIIETAASTPESENIHKRNQLREYAALNGTLRDDENQTCQNCGEVGHRKYECSERRNYMANITCRICGNAGHLARDCTRRNQNNFAAPGASSQALIQGAGGAFDSDLANLLNELGETAGGGLTAGSRDGAIGGAANILPWRRPELWLPGASGKRPTYASLQGYGQQTIGYASYGANPWQQAPNYDVYYQPQAGTD